MALKISTLDIKGYTPTKGTPRPAWTYRGARRNALHAKRWGGEYGPADWPPAWRRVK
jgi:hypothetical protein